MFDEKRGGTQMFDEKVRAKYMAKPKYTAQSTLPTAVKAYLFMELDVKDGVKVVGVRVMTDEAPTQILPVRYLMMEEHTGKNLTEAREFLLRVPKVFESLSRESKGGWMSYSYLPMIWDGEELFWRALTCFPCPTHEDAENTLKVATDSKNLPASEKAIVAFENITDPEMRWAGFSRWGKDEIER